MLLSCLRLGLTLKDVDELDIGMITDLIITNNNIQDTSTSGSVRKATQKDFDKF